MNRSWKTTLVGVVLGLVPLGQGILQGLAAGQHFDWDKIAIGAGLMALGTLSKDYDKTGKPVKKQKTPPAQN